MARRTFGVQKGRVRSKTAVSGGGSGRPVEEVVRELKSNLQKPADEDYRERSLAIHGLVCARCGRTFEGKDRRLLTVHHKDGNHHNNPPDGSNWENLCVYCHEDIHSREVLGDYFGGEGGSSKGELVYSDESASDGFGTLAEQLKNAGRKK